MFNFAVRGFDKSGSELRVAGRLFGVLFLEEEDAHIQ